MDRLTLRSSVALSFLLSLTLPGLAAAQKTSGFPAISQRYYKSGSAAVKVTGSFTVDQVIPINAQASFSDGEATWLQFGVSAAAEANSLITYGQTREIGIQVGKGKQSATAGIIEGEASQCSGTVEVTKTEIIGAYTCQGVTSYDGKGMGQVDIAVKFTVGS